MKPKTFTLNRRDFLKGASALGAVGLAMPLMPRLAYAAGAFPKRLVVFFSPNGKVEPNRYWRPESSGGKLTTLSDILQPLENHKNDFTVINGLNLDCAQNAAPVGEFHVGGACGILTGRFLASGNFNMGFGYSSGISLDLEIANRLSGQTAISSLQLGIQSNGRGNNATISHRGENDPVFMERDGAKIFDRIFGQGIQEPDIARKIRKRKKSVLDFLKSDLAKVNAKLSSEDRLKVERHLVRFRELEQTLANGTLNQCGGFNAPGDKDWGNAAENGMQDTADFQIKQMVQALACDRTRVATIQFSISGGENIGNEYFGNSYYHKVAHDKRIDKWLRVNKFESELFAKILSEMKNIQEGEGTLLDNSVVLWVNELADGETHSFKDIPIVVAGGLGGALNTKGRHIELSGRSTNDLLTTVMHGFGYNEDFGDPQFGTGGPIGELLF